MPKFEVLVMHPSFEDHQADADRSVVAVEEALEAWYGERLIVRNRKGRRGPYLMVGSTSAGRDITVVLLPTAEEGTWMAYTAWDTKHTDR